MPARTGECRPRCWRDRYGRYRSPFWWPDWHRDTAVIVASGPSAQGADLAQAEGRCRVLTINESWRLCPWADVLYASDAEWWAARRPAFQGIRICRSAVPGDASIRHVARVRGYHRIVPGPCGLIGDSRNSGFQALNLTVQFGARRILLVGFDMTVAGGSHWHGDHGGGLTNPDAAKISVWRSSLDTAAGDLSAMGVTVVNCSPVSALTAYPKMSLKEAMRQ